MTTISHESSYSQQLWEGVGKRRRRKREKWRHKLVLDGHLRMWGTRSDYLLSRCWRSRITIYSCSSLTADMDSANSRISLSNGSISAVGSTSVNAVYPMDCLVVVGAYLSQQSACEHRERWSWQICQRLRTFGCWSSKCVFLSSWL